MPRVIKSYLDLKAKSKLGICDNSSDSQVIDVCLQCAVMFNLPVSVMHPPYSLGEFVCAICGHSLIIDDD